MNEGRERMKEGMHVRRYGYIGRGLFLSLSLLGAGDFIQGMSPSFILF